MRRVLGGVCAVMAVITLSSCSLFSAPGVDEVAGVYSADDATVNLNDDGTCRVENYPDDIDEGADGQPRLGARFDADCTWEIGGLLYSGAWEIEIPLLLLNLKWSGGCLQRSVGDPDAGNDWELCAAE